VRKPERAARGSQAHAVATRLRANATGIGWCRRVAGRKPHSRAKSDSSLGVPARRHGCRSRRTTPRFREARSTGKRNVWTRTRVPRTLRKEPNGDSKASTIGSAVAKPRCRERPEPGVRKDVAGQRFSRDGRHSRSILRSSRSRESAGGGLGDSRGVSVNVRTVAAWRESDRGVRGSVRTHHGGNTTPTAMIAPPKGATCDPPKRVCSDVDQAIT